MAGDRLYHYVGDVAYTDFELREMLVELDELEDGLTEWESGFVGDLIDREPDRYTTDQAHKIVEVYRERA